MHVSPFQMSGPAVDDDALEEAWFENNKPFFLSHFLLT